MKLYKLESIKSYLQTKLSKETNYQKIKKEISHFLSPQFLIYHYELKTVILDKNYIINMLISEELFYDHIKKFNDKFNLNIRFNSKRISKFSNNYNKKDYISYQLDNVLVDFENIVDNHYKNKEIRNLIHLKKNELKIKQERKIYFKNVLVDTIPDNIDKCKILSIDFEYDKNTLYEVGMALYNNGLTLNKYYITNLKQGTRDNQFQFKFGESIIVNEINVIYLLKRYLDQFDYVLFHGAYNDISILNQYNIELSDYPNLKVLDTYHLYTKLFNNGEIKNASLVDILEKFNINYEHLHNAGNDAQYTLKALLKMNQNQPKI